MHACSSVFETQILTGFIFLSWFWSYNPRFMTQLFPVSCQSIRAVLCSLFSGMGVACFFVADLYMSIFQFDAFTLVSFLF